MKPETMLVAYELPFRYYSDNSLTAPINWSYQSRLQNREHSVCIILFDRKG